MGFASFFLEIFERPVEVSHESARKTSCARIRLEPPVGLRTTPVRIIERQKFIKGVRLNRSGHDGNKR